MAFDLDGAGGLALSDALGAAGGRGTYGAVGLDAVTVDGRTALLPAGRHDDRMAFHRLNASGDLDGVRILGAAPEIIGSIEATLNFEIDGKTFLIAAQQGQDGFRSFRVRDDLSVEYKAKFADDETAALGNVDAMTSLQINGRSYFFTASSDENAVSSWWMGRWGNVKARDTVDAADGLWVSAPTAMAAMEVAGRGYVVLGAAGSDSLTVLRMNKWGGLFVNEHVLDTRDTRFGGVQALESFEVAGRSFLVAGGADDGLTLFELAPTGRLVLHGTVADSVEAGLSNVAAIEAVVTGSSVDLYVTSSAEAGVTHLSVDLSALGVSRAGWHADDTLTGTAADDILVGAGGDDLMFGGAGDDVLIDGADIDAMTGGPGADRFVFLADGRMDTVTDFEPGLDRLDLGDYPLLHDISRLEMIQKGYGVLISYGRDRFRIEAEDRQLRIEELSPDDFIFA